MITERDLQEAIAECEGQRNPTSSTCLKLAAFYTIRDKMYPNKEDHEAEKIPQYSYARSPRSDSADTEFRRMADRINYDDLIDIMDELMDAVHVMIPKLYDGVMRKMSEI